MPSKNWLLVLFYFCCCCCFNFDYRIENGSYRRNPSNMNNKKCCFFRIALVLTYFEIACNRNVHIFEITILWHSQFAPTLMCFSFRSFKNGFPFNARVYAIERKFFFISVIINSDNLQISNYMLYSLSFAISAQVKLLWNLKPLNHVLDTLLFRSLPLL